MVGVGRRGMGDGGCMYGGVLCIYVCVCVDVCVERRR